MKHRELVADNTRLCHSLLTHLVADPRWRRVTTVGEGTRIACEVWGWLCRTHGIEPGEVGEGRIRSLVRRALAMRALARGYQEDPEAAKRLGRERMESMSLAADVLTLFVELDLIKPEGVDLAVICAGRLQQVEEAAIGELLPAAQAIMPPLTIETPQVEPMAAAEVPS